MDGDTFNETLAALHRSNDRTKHPAQRSNMSVRFSDVNEQENERNPSYERGHPSNERGQSSTERRHDPPQIPPGPGGHKSSISQDQQEVTQYCTIPNCGWSSYKSFDAALLDTCFQQLKLHMQVTHSISQGGTTSESGATGARSDKSAREYAEATKTRKIVKVVDDAVANLCEARFFPTPLDLTVLGKNMPVAISPVNTVVEFAHLGVDVINQDVLRKLHARTNNVLRLRECSNINLRNYHAAGDELVAVEATQTHLKLGKNLVKLSSPKDCLLAFYNYCAMATNYHVLDWSPKALLKVAMEKYFSGPPTVSQYNLLFEKYITENAIRAQKRACPLTYQEILQLWNSFVCTYSDNMSNVEALVDQKIKNLGNKPGKRGLKGTSASYSKKPKKEFCPTWNVKRSYPLCENEQVDGGCKDANGNVLIHSCTKRSFKANGQLAYCTSAKHGFYTH